ncbi:Nuclear envelope morphology protein 1 [Linderina macrospora]|uniref:Nuclear envelope morphology protein 1 n=1 Tax=Linderina macrospora TaxID=4868 RepID=A0ACC1J4A3_9FUNG|nr:Nuclear envelope morphology protein 1 [Linderina macrospora]
MQRDSFCDEKSRPIVRPPPTQRPTPTRRFSAIYFALIYLYTLFYGLLESVPLLDRLLQHLPNPHTLVSDEYQPISTQISSAHSASLGGRKPRHESLAMAKRANRHSMPAVPSTPPSSITRSLKKKTLVLDLDETLIHSSPQGSYRAHHRIEVVIDKVACLYYVYKRPHVDYFLRKVSEWYKVVVFTASLAEYADPVIDLLDAQRKYISGRFFRESCIPHDTSYAKDLTAVDPDLSQIVLIDNSPLSYFINQTNGIPIQPWVNSDPKDEALLDLLPLLDALRFTDDVRSILSLRIV